VKAGGRRSAQEHREKIGLLGTMLYLVVGNLSVQDPLMGAGGWVVGSRGHPSPRG
jgi:hypothetical protein